MDLKDKTIELCVTGGIAAYKAADLVSRLKKQQAEVFVIMTKSACEFITPMTLEVLSGNRVVTDMFSRDFPWEVEHISLAARADVFVIAPCTANVLGKAAHGIADDMVTTTLLATRAPLVIAPAMNTNMYENPVVQQNMRILANRGAHFVEPASGRLACGAVGRGKLADPADICEAILDAAAVRDLAGLRVLVTAGPTQEALDPVRFLSNHSTGKMGYAIAEAARRRGAEVTLVTGPTALPAPVGVRTVPVVSAREMYDAVLAALPEQDFVIKAAAVGDYRPAEAAPDKLKKKNADMTLTLVRNPDILKAVGERKRPGQIVCGFSMETRDLLENSAAKLESKNCDFMIANNLKTAGAGFGTDTNVVTVLRRGAVPEQLPIQSKATLADGILDRLLAAWDAR